MKLICKVTTSTSRSLTSAYEPVITEFKLHLKKALEFSVPELQALIKNRDFSDASEFADAAVCVIAETLRFVVNPKVYFDIVVEGVVEPAVRQCAKTSIQIDVIRIMGTNNLANTKGKRHWIEQQADLPEFRINDVPIFKPYDYQLDQVERQHRVELRKLLGSHGHSGLTLSEEDVYVFRVIFNRIITLVDPSTTESLCFNATEIRQLTKALGRYGESEPTFKATLAQFDQMLINAIIDLAKASRF